MLSSPHSGAAPGLLNRPEFVSADPSARPALAASIARYAAIATMVALGMRQFVQSGATTGYLIALLLAPVWLGTLRRYRGARLLAIVGSATLVWGIVLRDIAAADHIISSSVQIRSTVLLAGILLSICAILWARTVLSSAEVGLWYGAGMILNAVLTGTSAGNPWKNTWAIPVAIVVLSAINLSSKARAKRASLPGVVVLVVLAVISAFSDSRSYAATFLIAAILVGWQSRPTNLSRRSSAYLTVVMLVGVAASTYWLGTKLLVSGYLGANAQVRTVAQIEQSGSVILGGRPELQATIALMRSRPSGFGVGVEPTGQDILIAKTGLSSINYNPNNGYVEKFMFGGHIELHSVFGDLWASWGIPGLVLLLLLALNLVRSISTTISRGLANPLVVFLVVWTLWNLLFSPIYGSAPTLTLAVGLAIMYKADLRSGMKHRSAPT
jgi:hypothetical protein